MPPRPRVAVVVTCFNDGSTLGEAIHSVRGATETTELVVVNDGSTDEATLRLLEGLEQSGVRVIHQANQGQAAAAMAGVRATSAPYVMRFDADDLLEPAGVSILADLLDRAPDAAAAWGDVQTFGVTTFRIPGPPALDPWLITYTNCVTGSGSLLRRSALIESGGWQLTTGYEDWDTWMALAERGHTGVGASSVVFRHRRDLGGQLARWLSGTEGHYEALRLRHPRLFAERGTHRRTSRLPKALKLAVLAVDSLPVSRLTKIHLCELFARLFWAGGPRATAPMLWQALALRVRTRVARHRPAAARTSS